MKTPPRNHRWLSFVYAAIAIALAMPMLTLIYLSLVRQWEFPALLGSQFSTDNWQAAYAGTAGIWDSILISVAISASVSLIATATGWILARVVCYHPRGARLMAFAYFPYLLAPVILGVMLQFFFIKLGIAGTVFGVITAQLLFIIPYAILFFAGFWTPHTRALEGQAITLGANPAQVFRKLLLPIARPWLAMAAFQCFMISWFEYGLTQYVGIGKVPTLTVRTMMYVKEANPHIAAVAACTMVLPLLLLIILNRSWLYRNTEQHD